MAVSENDLVVGPLTPAAGVTTISLDFFFEDAAWLEVYKSGSDTPLVLNTDYTVTGAGTSSGVVTLTTPAAGIEAYSIYLAVPLERSSDMQLRGEFKSGPFNVEMDRLWQAVQGIDTRLRRAFQVSRTSVSVAALFSEDALARGSGVLQFSPDGLSLEVGPTISGALAANSKAEEWAENPVDDPVEPGKFSALHHATKAGEDAATASAAAAAAAEAIGAEIYDTKADADTALAGLAEDSYAMVLVDETRQDRRTLYKVESSAFTYIRELGDQTLASLTERYGFGGHMRYTENTLSLWNDGYISTFGYGGVDYLPKSMTASQSGTTVTASTSVFEKLYVGCIIRWDSGEEAVITDIDSFSTTTTCTVDRSQSVSSGAATIHAKHLVGLLYGDSLGIRISAALQKVMHRALGFGGYVFSPNGVERNFYSQMASSSLAGGATTEATSDEYAAYPWSQYWKLPSGGSLALSMASYYVTGQPRTPRTGLDQIDVANDTFVLVWERAAGAFTVERKRFYDAEWEAVDTVADASTGARAYNFATYSHDFRADWEYRVTSTSGTVVVVAAAMMNNSRPGFVYWPMSRGGQNIASFAALPEARLTELCQIFGQPNFRSVIGDPESGTSGYAAAFAGDRALWAAAAPMCDHVWWGGYDAQASYETLYEAWNAAARAIALANDDTFINIKGIMGDFDTQGSKIGFLADGIHPGEKGIAVFAHRFLEVTGMGKHPLVREARDVDASFGNFGSLEIARRNVKDDMARIRVAATPRGAKWDRSNCMVRCLDALGAAIGSDDFTAVIDFEMQENVVATQYLLVCNANEGGLSKNSSIEIVQNAGDRIQVWLRNGSGTQKLYQWDRMGIAYGGTRRMLTIRSDRTNSRFDLFIDGVAATAGEGLITGTGPDLSAWVGVGQDVSIINASGAEYPIYGAMFWRTALTDAEIGNIAAAGEPQATTPDFWWDFSEGVGRAVRDRTSNGKNAAFEFGNFSTRYFLDEGDFTWLNVSHDDVGPVWLATDNAATKLVTGDNMLVTASGNRNFSLPASATVGQAIKVTIANTGTKRITQAAGQQIKSGASATTAGTGGRLTIPDATSITLRCVVGGASTLWIVEAHTGAALTFT